MAAVSGVIRQRIAEVGAFIQQNRMQSATEQIKSIISSLNTDELILVSPDLRDLIGKMHPKRKRDLTVLLDDAIAKPKSAPRRVQDGLEPTTQPGTLTPSRATQYSLRLNELRKRHIFQWGTYYRDNLIFMFKDLMSKSNSHERWHEELDLISVAFSNHATDIYGHGYKRSIDKGLTEDVAETKAVNGLQHFLYLVMGLFIDNREKIDNARDARQLWEITSAFIVGILKGYGATELGTMTGWDLLARHQNTWLPALGFARGTDALSFFMEFPQQKHMEDASVTIVPTLLGIEKLANQFHNNDFILPRLSRIAPGTLARLDITFNVEQHDTVRDLMISCFFREQILNIRSISEAITLRANLVIARISQLAGEWESNISSKVLDVTEVGQFPEHLHDFSELVLAKLQEETSADADLTESGTLERNYARDFPLEDPEFRRLFLVERHSVKKLFEELEDGTGVHLWCSVRRSGKTTAVSSLADTTSRSVVVFQTMDHQPNRVEQNILERRVREALDARKGIPENFFQQIVEECVLANVSIESNEKKVVLVIDEYESLFGLIAAYTRDDSGLRYMVAQPLLSQMVGFSTNNLLILMGQRPDGHLILSSQNQLSPLVKHQYNFPLFQHFLGASDTEFTQFLRRVLSDKLPFTSDFSDAIYEETSGHPYLTVNLMVDFCEWLISNHVVVVNSLLDAKHFDTFAKDRLTQAALRRSQHYIFFHGMLADYLSESARKNEPWLYSVATVLQEISRKHPKILTCSIASFHHIAGPLGSVAQMTPERLLVTAAMSNFLRVEGGQVSPGIRLMARLAQSSTTSIN